MIFPLKNINNTWKKINHNSSCLSIFIRDAYIYLAKPKQYSMDLSLYDVKVEVSAETTRGNAKNGIFVRCFRRTYP